MYVLTDPPPLPASLPLATNSANQYSADIFHTNFKADPTNSSEGRRYRREVLERGSSVDELRIMTEYLGRDVNPEGLYAELNLLEGR